MANLVVIYGKPADAEAFDAYYFGHHVPLDKTIPGVRSYTVSKGTVATPAGPAEHHRSKTISRSREQHR